MYSKKLNLKLKSILVLVSGLYASSAFALEPFVVKDIRIEGIQRTEAGTVFNYLPVKVGETVNLNVKMLGTLTNPDIKFDLKESASSVAEDIKEQAKDFAQARIDSSKKADKDTVQSLKKEVVKAAGEKLKEQLFNKKDTATADSLKTKPVKPEDRIKESGKGLIENLNPFKKKK